MSVRAQGARGFDFDALTFAFGVVLSVAVLGVASVSLELAHRSGKVSKSSVRVAEGVAGLALALGAGVLAYLIFHASVHAI